MSKPKDHQGLEFWKRHLTDQQMPVLAETAQTIVNRAADSSSSAADLSRLVLQDVSMTTRVLRMANSFYYKPGEGKITTISRAVVLLGFDAVRNICVSLSLIDTFLRGPNRDEAVAEMALCFHAAVQAKSLAELSQQKDPEEVFIATLLYHLGTLAFWCFAGDVDAGSADKLKKALQSGDPPEMIERDVLGFGLNELTVSLNQHWGLSQLLTRALDYRAAPTPSTRAIGFGHAIAKAMRSPEGAHSLERVLTEIEHSLKLPVDTVRVRVQTNAQAAAETMAAMGAPDAARLIPRLAAATAPVEPAKAPAVARTPDAEPVFGQNLQMDILRELANLLEEPKPNVNLMLEMVLEGIYRGVGMDRAIFALLSPDRQQIRAKYVLGDDPEQLREQFVFPAAEPGANALAHALSQGQAVWIGRPGTPQALRTHPVLQQLSGGHFFLMPLAVAGKPVGCLYADRGKSGRALDAELFSQFKLFGQQARMGLTWLKAG